ncbi:MAG: MBL fold metallo-hydrolase [Gemmatimonadota bacterium]
MSLREMRLTYIGGPTALIEIGGLRFLTDPTFDPAGTEYPTPVYTLRKTQDPAIRATDLEPVDVVLLSHDHHFDNLDHAGRVVVNAAPRVLTTEAGAGRLGGRTTGLAPGQSVTIPTPDGRLLTVTATPGRHGPPDGDRGPVIGFVIADIDEQNGVVYLSGDTVWYEGVAAVARRFSVFVAVLFAGAARVQAVGPAALTFTAAELVQASRVFDQAAIVPLHFEGWAHFSESRDAIAEAFVAANLIERLRWPQPGRALRFDQFGPGISFT